MFPAHFTLHFSAPPDSPIPAAFLDKADTLGQAHTTLGELGNESKCSAVKCTVVLRSEE